MFAGALLMPSEHVRQFITRIPDRSPWEMFGALENACRRFQVSLPALIKRLGTVKERSRVALIVLCLRYLRNRFTELEPTLRVQSCASMGGLRNVCTWPNRTAKGLNLLSARDLFEEWRKTIGGNKERTGGRYVLAANGVLARATPESLTWRAENIPMSAFRAGKWYKERVALLTASCLYAKKGWDEKEAYVVTLLRHKD